MGEGFEPLAGERPLAAVVARAIDLEEPGAAVDACMAIALETPVPLRGAAEQARQWLRDWAGMPAADLQVVLAGLDGVDPLSCFAAAVQQSAADAARLVLLAEVVLERRPDDPVGLPYRPHLMAVAERCGWRLVKQHDLTAEGLQHLRRLRGVVQRQQRKLAADPCDPQAAVQELDRRLARAGSGGYRCEALCFERQGRPALQLVPVGEARAAAMRRLFKQVFGHEMTAAHWQWKYGAGRGCAVALEQDGELVAHYGGQRRPLRVQGRHAVGCQICDVMVAPSANRSLQRRGPMQRVAATFLETQLGWGLPHRIGFGFPNDRHNGLADRLKLYTAVDRLVQVSWPASPLADTGRWRPEAVVLEAGHIGARQGRAIDTLWHAMAADMSQRVLGVRDRDWLQWRYLSGPHAQYRLTLVRSRWLRRPLGLFVTRPRDDGLELLDLVAPSAGFATLVALARAQAAAEGQRRLRAWITRSQATLLTQIDPAHARLDELPISIPANIHCPGPDPRELQNRWFLMGGDADFT